MFKFPPLITPCLALLSLTIATQARAADSCSLSTVLQPAIDAAATTASCNADGVYLSGNVLADAITTKCNKSKNIERCRSCVKEEKAKDFEIIKALIKQGLFGRTDAPPIKAALEALKKTTCGVLPPVVPTATPTPGPGDDNNNNPEEHPAPTPPPSGTPKPNVEIGPLLQVACPCQGTFTSHDSYLQCATNFLGGKVTAGMITKDRAYEIYFNVQKNTCGSPPPPTPTAAPTSHPI